MDNGSSGRLVNHEEGRAESTSPLFLRQTRSAAIFRRGVATVAVQRSAAGVTGFGVRTWRRFSKCRGKLVFFRNFSIYHRSESCGRLRVLKGPLFAPPE